MFSDGTDGTESRIDANRPEGDLSQVHEDTIVRSLSKNVAKNRQLGGTLAARERRRKRNVNYRSQPLNGSSNVVKATVEFSLNLKRGVSRFTKYRTGTKSIRPWYTSVIVTMRDIMSLLRTTHDACFRETSSGFTGSACRAISYVKSLVNETVKFLIRESCAATITRDIEKLVLKVYRKFSHSMCRLFAEQVLQAARTSQMATMGAAANDNDSILFRCHVCMRFFDKTFHYLQHIRVHYRLTMYICFECGDTFVQQNGLNYHKRRCERNAHRGDDDGYDLSSAPAYELCESCDTFHEQGSPMRNHVLLNHATMNIDLGINRAQQYRMEKLLNDFDE